MTISTQNLTELQTKVLKIAKGLGRFTVDDVTPILGVFDYQVQTAVSPLMELGYIKMISDREYLYTRHSNPAGNRQSRPLVLQPNDSNDDNDPIDPWLTIEEAARLLNNKPNTQ